MGRRYGTVARRKSARSKPLNTGRKQLAEDGEAIDDDDDDDDDDDNNNNNNKYFIFVAVACVYNKIIKIKKIIILVKTESRAIAGRTARCCCKFRYVSKFTMSR